MEQSLPEVGTPPPYDSGTLHVLVARNTTTMQIHIVLEETHSQYNLDQNSARSHLS